MPTLWVYVCLSVGAKHFRLAALLTCVLLCQLSCPQHDRQHQPSPLPQTLFQLQLPCTFWLLTACPTAFSVSHSLTLTLPVRIAETWFDFSLSFPTSFCIVSENYFQLASNNNVRRVAGFANFPLFFLRFTYCAFLPCS